MHTHIYIYIYIYIYVYKYTFIEMCNFASDSLCFQPPKCTLSSLQSLCQKLLKLLWAQALGRRNPDMAMPTLELVQPATDLVRLPCISDDTLAFQGGAMHGSSSSKRRQLKMGLVSLSWCDSVDLRTHLGHDWSSLTIFMQIALGAADAGSNRHQERDGRHFEVEQLILRGVGRASRRYVCWFSLLLVRPMSYETHGPTLLQPNVLRASNPWVNLHVRY